MLEAWLLLEQAQIASGDFDEAAATVIQLSGHSGGQVSPEEAEALEDAVDRDGARAYWAWKIDHLERRQAAGQPVLPSQFAMAYAGLGQNEQAFVYLDSALAEKDPGLFTLRSHPAWTRYATIRASRPW